MSHIDWGAYLDKSMPAAERAAIEARLKAEEPLRRELAGFEAFRAAIFRAGTAEAVPAERLSRALAGAARTKTPAPPQNRMIWLVAPVAVAAVTLAWFNFPRPIPELGEIDPYTLGKSQAIDGVQMKDPVSAVQWLREKTTWEVPLLTLEGVASICEVRRGVDWARLDLSVKGHTAYLYVAQKDSFGGAPQFKLEGLTFFKGAKGLGWRNDGLAYYVEGCDPAIQQVVAVAAYREMQHPAKLPSFGSRGRVR